MMTLRVLILWTAVMYAGGPAFAQTPEIAAGTIRYSAAEEFSSQMPPSRDPDQKGLTASVSTTMSYAADLTIVRRGEASARVSADWKNTMRSETRTTLECADRSGGDAATVRMPVKLFMEEQAISSARGDARVKVFVLVDGDDYKISFTVPAVAGSEKTARTITYLPDCSGQPRPSDNFSNAWSAPEQSVEFAGKIDRRNPSHLAGSTVQGTTRIEWSLDLK